MRKAIPVFMAVMAMSAPALADRALGRGDVAGKSICWSDGVKETYGKDSSFKNSNGEKGTYEFITGPTLLVHANTADWSAALTLLPDGSITSPQSGLPGNMSYASGNIGHFCK